MLWKAVQDPGARANIKANSKFTLAHWQDTYDKSVYVLGSENPQNIVPLLNMLAINLASGNYKQAEDLLLRMLSIQEKTLEPHDLKIVRSLNHLAVLYFIAGEYAKAKPILLRALAIKWDPLVTAYLTSSYVESKKYALDIYNKLLGPNHLSTALALDDLANLYRESSDYAQAELLYERALRIREKALSPDSLDLAASLTGLIEFYRKTGAADKAVSLFLRKLKIIEGARGHDHPDILATLDDLAEYYTFTGAYDDAIVIHRRALAIREKVLPSDHPDILRSIRKLAVSYYAKGDHSHALPLLERTQEIEEIRMVRFMREAPESEKWSYMRQREKDVDLNVSFSLAATDPKAKKLGLTDLIRYKGRILDASLPQREVIHDIGNLGITNRNSQRGYNDPRADWIQKFSAMVFRGPSDLSYKEYRARLERLALEGEFKENIRFKVGKMELEYVRTSLPNDGVLVEWVRYKPFDPKAKNQNDCWGDPRYAAYVLRPTGDVVAFDMGQAQRIDALVTEFRESLYKDDTTYRVYAKSLFDSLIAPLNINPEQSKKLLLIPDGPLNLVPFAALIDKYNEPLIQQFEIIYFTSGSELARIPRQSIGEDWPVIVANPDYGTPAADFDSLSSSLNASRSPGQASSRLLFSQLPGAETEGRMLKAFLHLDDNNKRFITGAQATKNKLRTLRGPQILHLATHGFFLPDEEPMSQDHNVDKVSKESRALARVQDPMLRSGLALAGANISLENVNDNGLLTAAEVAELKLTGTQLVVLSACDTGVGKIEQSEGVVGLRRALVLAGAETQVVSLWKVNDDASQELMEDYYRGLYKKERNQLGEWEYKNEGRSEALRSAQLKMMKRPERQHPYFWASFIPIGDWNPIY